MRAIIPAAISVPVLFGLSALFALGCGDKGDDTGESTGWDVAEFSGGSFQFTTTAADDVCFDGAFAALFLPEGAGSTNNWEYPVELPAWTGLPATYDIQLQEPFSTMEVTVSAGSSAGLMTIDGARQEDVYLDADSEAYGNCQVDMDIAVEVTIDSEDVAHGSAVLTLDNIPTDDCPAIQADPCTMTLDFNAARI